MLKIADYVAAREVSQSIFIADLLTTALMKNSRKHEIILKIAHHNIICKRQGHC